MKNIIDKSSNENYKLITEEEAAEDDFYPWFEFRSNSGILVYTLTESFLRLSCEGLYDPQENQGENYEHQDKSDYYLECATNYLVKNFWHNIVHMQIHNIQQFNYKYFREESRYSSDFEADSLATVMLALSYALKVETKHSSLDYINKDLQSLVLKNRCNKVFKLRDECRRKYEELKKNEVTYHEPKTVHDLLEKEWLIRRRLANALCMYCLERGRALTTVSVYFFGQIENTYDSKHRVYYYQRPNSHGAVKINGIYFPLYELGNFAYSEDNFLKNAINSLVVKLFVDYSTMLRNNQRMKNFAHNNLKHHIRQLINEKFKLDDEIIEVSDLA